MYCLKCGKESEGTQVFCDHCLSVMDNYPIKPDTRVQLPRRTSAQVQKKQVKRRTLSPEEQALKMRVTIRTLAALWGVTLIALGISLWLLFSDPDWGFHSPVSEDLPQTSAPAAE